VPTYAEDIPSIAEYTALRHLVFVVGLAPISFDPLPREYEQRSPCNVSILNDFLASMLVCDKVVPLGLAVFAGPAYLEESQSIDKLMVANVRLSGLLYPGVASGIMVSGSY
jgi:hypothetical protein